MVKQLGGIQGLMEKTKALGLSSNEPDAVRAAAAEFILEGLHAHRRISRNEERGFAAEEKRRGPGRERSPKGRTSGGSTTEVRPRTVAGRFVYPCIRGRGCVYEVDPLFEVHG